MSYYYDTCNRTDIKCPPRFTVATQLKPSEVERVQGMRLVMNEALSTLSELKVFRTETSLLSRFLYKYKRAFRQEKGVQYLSRIHQAIHRYESVGLAQIFINFVECIPCNITWVTTEAYLPTRQMLKWVLLRLLVVAKIMKRIIELSEDAGKYLFGRLRLGWSAHYMIFGVAVTGRIMSCAKFLLLSVVSWYRRLNKYINLLIETARFLPNFRFPRRVEEVVGPIDLDPPSRNDNFETVFELIDLTVEENQAKEQEDAEGEDDVVITNEIAYRDGAHGNEENQEDRQVAVEERTNDNRPDDEMAVVYDRRNTVQPSTSSPSPGPSSDPANSFPASSGLMPNLPSTSTGEFASSPSAIVASTRFLFEDSSSDDSDDSDTDPPRPHDSDDTESPFVRLDRQPKMNFGRYFKNSRRRD